MKLLKGLAGFFKTGGVKEVVDGVETISGQRFNYMKFGLILTGVVVLGLIIALLTGKITFEQFLQGIEAADDMK